MYKIFLPIDNVSDFKCYTIIDKDTIRGYISQPQINSNSDYIDFYINSHYLQKNGNQSWNQWATSLPVCLNNDLITTDFFYSTDFYSTLIITFILFYFIVLIPYKIFSRLFGRWLKV